MCSLGGPREEFENEFDAFLKFLEITGFVNVLVHAELAGAGEFLRDKSAGKKDEGDAQVFGLTTKPFEEVVADFAGEAHVRDDQVGERILVAVGVGAVSFKVVAGDGDGRGHVNGALEAGNGENAAEEEDVGLFVFDQQNDWQ